MRDAASKPREVDARYGRAAEMGYRYRARIEACTSFGRPRYRAVGERRFIDWREDGWRGPKRRTPEQALADANRWLDEKGSHPKDRAESYA